MVTKGQRRLGKTIRKLEGSVELSTKESKAKDAEKKYKQKAQASLGYTDDSPIQNLCDPSKWKKDKTKTD
jgi:sulfopyruvate decarboxylase TPP-binding subunit